MEFKELKEKTEAELQKMLKSNREKSRDLRFKVANKQLKDVGQIKSVKKLIAQILTVLNSKKSKGSGQPLVVEAGEPTAKQETK